MRQRIKELRESRVRAHEEATTILAAAAEAKRALTAEEREKVDKLHADIDAKKSEIDVLERQLEIDAELAASAGRRASTAGDDGLTDAGGRGTGQGQATSALVSFLREGAEGLSPEQRKAFKLEVRSRRQAIEIPLEVLASALGRSASGEELRNRAKANGEQRALSAITDAAGAVTIPEGFIAQLIEAQKQFGGVLNSRAFQFATAQGNDLPVPTVNGSDDVGELIAENVEVDEQDETFGSVIFRSYKFSSKLVRVPFELIEDSAFDIAGWLGRRLGTRLTRSKEQYLTTGTGTSQPQGIVTGATLGKTAASATAITYLEMLDLKHSVDPAYRFGAQWMFHDSTLLAVKKLLDSDNRPLWKPGISAGDPDLIDGDPYVINQNMASIATGQKTILYGDCSLFWVRNIGSLRLLRLAERFAEFDQVGFIGFMRMDSHLINAGTNPVKYLIQA